MSVDGDPAEARDWEALGTARPRRVPAIAMVLVCCLFVGAFAVVSGQPPSQGTLDVSVNRSPTEPVDPFVPADAGTDGNVALAPSTEGQAPGNGAVPRPPCNARVGTAGWCGIAPSPVAGRTRAATVWTGERMIVWGGFDDRDAPLADGAAYDPAADVWRDLPPAPIDGRGRAAAVWAFDRMLVWGGDGRGAELGDGAAYEPWSRTWERLPQAPIAGRQSPAAAWTGTELLVWGGWRLSRPLNDGAAYDPVRRRWRRLPEPPRRFITGSHAWGWTGEELLVVGTQHGMAYDPAADRWRLLPEPPYQATLQLDRGFAPQPAAWTGRELLVWFARDRRASALLGYDLARDRWRVAAQPPLRRRQGPVILWTGHGVVVWGGLVTGFDVGCREPRCAVVPRSRADGALYDPATDTWGDLTPGPLTGRAGASSVWTGEDVVVWGGGTPIDVRADGARLHLPLEYATRG